MDNLKVMDTLKAILTDLGIAEEFIHENTCLKGDLQLDSMETVEVALGLKRRLGVNIKLGATQDITLAQLCNLVEVEIAVHSKYSRIQESEVETRLIASLQESGAEPEMLRLRSEV